MQPIRFTEQFKNLLAVARQMTESAQSEAILVCCWKGLPIGRG